MEKLVAKGGILVKRQIRPGAQRFGIELRRIRKERGFTQSQLSAACHLSGSLMSGFECGTHWPKRDTVDAMEAALSANGDLLTLWIELSNRESYPDWLGELVEAEPQATQIREFETLVVPGLCQTGDYARTLVRAANSLAVPREVDEIVSARMRRQKLWDSPDPPHMTVVINEGVLTSPVGGVEVMGAQLDHIITMVEARRIRIQVIPLDTEHHPGMSGPFTLLSFRRRADVLYVENAVSGTMIHSPDQVQRMAMLFGDLQAVALSPERSLKRLHEIRERFRSEGTEDVA